MDIREFGDAAWKMTKEPKIEGKTNIYTWKDSNLYKNSVGLWA